MKAKLTKTFINNIKTKSRIDYFDTEMKGFILRNNVSGRKFYSIRYRNNMNKYVRYTIGEHGKITLMQAREEAKKLFGLLAQGKDIQDIKISNKKNKCETFGYFINNFYLAWFKQNRKGDKGTINALTKTLIKFHQYKVNEIDNIKIQKFIIEYQHKYKCSNKRINRIITAIRSSLNIAVEYSYIKENPLKGFKLLKEEKNNIVRYLSEQEEDRLLSECKNIYFQHKNIVILALNTGMRAGEIKSLKRSDINLKDKYINLRSSNTKSQKSRIIYLNDKSCSVIEEQYKKIKSEYLFLNEKTNSPFVKHHEFFKKLKESAKINNFRFHDLRHTFASKLAMKGVDLNTIRELLGHSDIKMTLIYAHLCETHKRKVIDML